MEGYQLGKDIQTIIEAVQRLEKGQGTKKPCHCDETARQEGSHILHLIGVIPVDVIDLVHGLPDAMKKEIKDNARSRSKIYLRSYGPVPVDALRCFIGSYDQTSTCCYINLYGKTVYARMIGVNVFCAEGFVDYYADRIEYCG